MSEISEKGDKTPEETTSIRDDEVLTEKVNIQILVQEAIKGISEYIPTIIDEHLANRGMISVAANSSEYNNDDNNDNDHQRDIGSQILTEKQAIDARQHNQDTGSSTTNHKGSSTRNKNETNSGHNFDNVSHLFGTKVNTLSRKRKQDDRESTPPLIMSQELLSYMDEELGIQDGEDGEDINSTWAKHVKHVYMDASADTVALNKVMKLYRNPGNLDVKVPKINKEIELNNGFQRNDKYVQSNEKALYATKNYVGKSLAIVYFERLG